MCIKNIPFPGGGLATIRKAVKQGIPLHILNQKTGKYIMIWPEKDLGQIRDKNNRKGFKVKVDGQSQPTILALDSAGWHLPCDNPNCA